MRVAFSLAGHGLGHAVRAQIITETLLDAGHEVMLFTGGSSYPFLKPFAEQRGIVLREMPVPQFVYRDDKKDIDKIRTGTKFLKYMDETANEIPVVREELIAFKPDVAVYDYEPLLPRAARGLCPIIAVGSQPFFSYCDLSSLSLRSRLYAQVVAFTNWLFCSWGDFNVIARAGVTTTHPKAEVVGPVLRPDVRNSTWQRGDFVLAYLKPTLEDTVVSVLKEMNLKAKVFGLGAREPEGQITYHASSMKDFLDALTTCQCLVASAGVAIVDEAAALRLPALFIPEPGQPEQDINAEVAEQAGFLSCNVKQFNRACLERLLKLERGPDKARSNEGPDRVLKVLERFAGKAPARPTGPEPIDEIQTPAGHESAAHE